MSKKVRFLGASDDQVRFGGGDDPRPLLTVGEVYAVKSVDVHSWHTRITLRQFPSKWFNSVCFENVP